MVFDATFWVAISFFIFFGGLIYLKIPKKINDLLSKMILDIKNEISESEKLRNESKILLGPAILSALDICFSLASKKLSIFEVSIPITWI